jgi:hypothetical protein
MFFSFNSAMVMICPRSDSPKPVHQNVFVSGFGRFSKEGIQGRQ